MNRGRKPTWPGLRVLYVRGPNKGRGGVIVAAPSGNQFRVALDGSPPGETTMCARTSVQVEGAPAPAATPVREWPRPIAEAAARVLNRFRADPTLDRLVVYRSPSGRVVARLWREQEVGPELVGVYTRDVTLQQLAEDLR